MKNMQDFHKWLSSGNETPAPDQRRFAALTRLNRSQLLHSTSELTWFYWNAPQSAGAS